MKSGSEIILEQLIHHHVDTIFGYPGGAIMPVYDCLLNYQDQLTHYRLAHEQGVVHAADGFARVTGNVGVCFVTSGPGATNAVTGIATAFMDSVPLIIFSGQVPSQLLGKDSFQEVDITSICEPITKKTFSVNDVNELAQVVDEAFYIARSGRPGPVLVDVPKDILLEKTDIVMKPVATMKYLKPVDYDLIHQIAMIIDHADRPIIYAGGGVKISKSSELLKALVKKTGIPVVNTLMGLGTFPRTHPLSLGLSGMHGHAEVNEAMTHCDLLIVIGARFSDRSIGKSSDFAKNAFIIQLDIDDTEFSKNINCDMYLDGALDENLKYLTEQVESKDHALWLNWIISKKQKLIQADLYCPENILKTVNTYFSDDTILITDTGQHQMWAAQHWEFKNPNHYLTSGGLGTMGYGLGAAIGATIAANHEHTVLVTGDGSFQMNCQDLVSVSKYELPLTIILMNNHSLGMVRQWQKLFNDKRYSETDNRNELSYVALCKAYNISAEQVSCMDSLVLALENRKKHTGPYLIEVIIDSNEDVFPFVPPGCSLSEYKCE